MDWYLLYNGKQMGPMSLEEARRQAQMNPHGLAWKAGWPEWLPIARVAELQPLATVTPVGPHVPPPVGKLEYKICGTEMQFVEITLAPGAGLIAEAGGMMFKDVTVEMEAIFGDGSTQSQGGGLFGKLVGAGKRLATGESLFMTAFTNKGYNSATIAFGAPYPGNIIPVNLAERGGTLICQKDAFLCATRGTAVGIHFQRKILTGLFGGEGFIMQKLEGAGMAFIHAGGTVIERELKPGEVLHVDTGCIVAYDPTVQFDIQQAGGVKTALFGGEGLFLAVLRGPGKILLQSLPFSRLAGRMMSAAPGIGSSSKGEGSVLGTIGDFFDGDNH